MKQYNQIFMVIISIFFTLSHGVYASCTNKTKWDWLCCFRRPQQHIFLKNCFRNSVIGSAYVTYKIYEDTKSSHIDGMRIATLSSVTGGAVLVMSLKETYYDKKAIIAKQ